MALILSYYPSVAGELVLGSMGGYLYMCDWEDSRRHPANLNRICRLLHTGAEFGSSPVIECAISQLDEYFQGDRRSFDIALRLCGTDFQQRMWQGLLNIPYGATVNYGEYARLIGRPGAVRAVAAAIGANPLSIIVPCHRVLGRNNSLTGYAGGLAAKKHLLELEKKRATRVSGSLVELGI